MNITDIDDKIIKRARQNYLYDKYKQGAGALPALLDDQREVLEDFKRTCEKNTDPDKRVMLEKTLAKMNAAVEQLEQAVSAGDAVKVEEAKLNYLTEAKDPIADWIDKREGDQVTENSIFEALPRYWEDEFHNDMRSLNVSIHVCMRVQETRPLKFEMTYAV